MIRDELKYVLGKKDFPLKKKGNKGKLVSLIQEWLYLNNLPVVIDGVYGPATKRAIKEFQIISNIMDTGKTDNATFSKLTAPIKRVLKEIPPSGNQMFKMVLAYARVHLKQHPREVGGQNKGPWVRLYMQGNEGKYWAWCAGFVSFIVQQASQAMNVDMPFTPTWLVPSLAREAKKKGIFLSGKKGAPLPGYIFLQRSKKGYSHCGFVISTHLNSFKSIEGNTNDDGSAEGYEVCVRIRNYKNKDFVII